MINQYRERISSKKNHCKKKILEEKSGYSKKDNTKFGLEGSNYGVIK
jgi:hypothetical protein